MILNEFKKSKFPGREIKRERESERERRRGRERDRDRNRERVYFRS